MPTSLDVYAPFDDGPGANTMESTWRKFARYMLETGIIRTAGNRFNTFGDSSGMQVKVDTGECWIQGHYGENASVKTLPIAAAHATLARLDRVVLRADFVNNRVELDVLTGTAATTPVLPTLTTNTSVWEVSLAQVSVAAGATGITSSDVTDDRTRYVYTDHGPGAMLEQKVLTAQATFVKFSSLPNTFKHLRLIFSSRVTAAGGTRVLLQLNSDTSASYDRQTLAAGGTSVTGNRLNAASSIEIGYSTPTGVSSHSAYEVLIAHYSKTGQVGKSVSSQGSHLAGSGGLTVVSNGGIWYGSGSSSAVDDLHVFSESGSFQVGSVFTLYGLG